MPSFSRQADSAPLTAVDTERLLDGHGAHREAPAVQHVVAGLLDIAAGPANDQELAGEAAAVAAFVRATGERAARSERFRRRARPGRAIAAAIAAAVVVAFSGAAAADALPWPIQELAHRTFGAPAPRPSGTLPKATVPSATPAPAASHRTPHGKAKAPGKKTSQKTPAHGTAKATAKAKVKAKAKATATAKPVPPGQQRPAIGAGTRAERRRDG
jgi:hypothetical protein